ncbi:DedA family protein [Rhodococcus daqingensis]|uniref:DedA family protein n=1 Tax=Rhodococcus daqingensis TaxID=2479363 RepID=A0ABW2RZH3_9NOCA
MVGVPSVDAFVGLCAPALLACAGLLLAVEAGLLIGLLIPAGTLVLGLGFLVGIGELPVAPTVVTVAAASTAGAQLGFLRARRRGPGSLRLPVRVSRRISTVAEPLRTTFRRWPTALAGVGHFFGGARTLSPRLAAATGVSYRRFAVTSVGASLVWSAALVLTGRLAGMDSTVRELFSTLALPVLATVLLAQWVIGRRAGRERVGSVAELGDQRLPERPPVFHGVGRFELLVPDAEGGPVR